MKSEILYTVPVHPWIDRLSSEFVIIRYESGNYTINWGDGVKRVSVGWLQDHVPDALKMLKKKAGVRDYVRK